MLGTAVIIALVVAVSLAVLLSQHPEWKVQVSARTLRWAALAATIVTVVILAPTTIRDNFARFTLLGLGLPILFTVLPVIAQRLNRGVQTVTWVCALAMIGWALLLTLGIGLFLLPAAVLLLAAAVSQHARATPIDAPE